LQDNSMLPYLDWSRIGQQLLVSSNCRDMNISAAKPRSDSSGSGSSNSISISISRTPIPAVLCWAAAAELQAAARVAKQKQRKQRQLLKRQQQQQAGSQHQQQQLSRPVEHRRRAAAAAGVSKDLYAEQVQQQQTLLPQGWYVARTWRVLLQALSGNCQQQQQQQAIGRSRAAAVLPAVLAAGEAKSRAVSRAVQQGQLAWAPKAAAPAPATPPPPPPAAAAAAVGEDGMPAVVVDAMEIDEGAAGCSVEAAAAGKCDNAQQHQQQQQQQCLVRVSVKIIGKGRCKQGALLLTQPCPVTAAAATGLGSSSSNSERATRNLQVASLLGYVTTSVPRGAPASLYPGGLGFCSVQGLWRLRCQDVTAGSSRVLRVWVLNPGSSAVRRAELTLLLDG
jgi:hypothetical protein